MHIEQCPVCSGVGKVIDQFAGPDVPLKEKVNVCHGCVGRGYIQVYDASDMEVMMKIPELKQLLLDSMRKAMRDDEDVT